MPAPVPSIALISSPQSRELIFTPNSRDGISRVRQATVSNPREINGAYLLDEINNSMIVFQNMPAEFSDSKSADWSDTSIPGRSEPIKGYNSSGARQFQLDLVFVESMDQGDGPVNGGGPDGSRPTYVQSKVHKLQSLVYPDYSGSFVTPPHTCLLVIGYLIRSRVVVTDVAVTYQGPWDTKYLLPLMATCNVTMEEVNTKAWGEQDVRNITNFSHPEQDNSFDFYTI